MQLYIIDWLFENAEDQLFATNEFCEYLNKGKMQEIIEGFEDLFATTYDLILAGQAVTNAFGENHLTSDHSIKSDEDKKYMNNKFIRFCVIHCIHGVLNSCKIMSICLRYDYRV